MNVEVDAGADAAGDKAGRSGLGRRRILVGTAVGLLLVLGVLLGPDYFEVFWGGLSREFHRKTAFLYLDGLLIGYALALVAAVGLIGGVVVSRAIRRPEDPARRRSQVRRLAIGVLLVVTLIGLDVGSAIWTAWQGHAPALPELIYHSEGPAGTPDDQVPGGSPVLPDQFPADEAKGIAQARPLRILVIGESSGRGEPYHPWLSVGQIAGWKLESVFPGRKVDVDIWAYGGAILRKMHNLLAGLTYRPDALMVYVGHNEFQGRYTWQREPGGYYDDDMPSLFTPTTLRSLLRFSPTCRLAVETWERQRVDLRPPHYATRELIDQPVTTSQEFAEIVDDFRRRLDAIARYCEQIHSLGILVIPAANDGDFDPSRSYLPPGTPRVERVAFAEEVIRVRALEKTDPDEAIRQYRKLVARHPEFAETHYRLGTLLRNAGRWDDAREHFVLAREKDGLPLRCPEAFRRVYREVAAAHPSVILVDGPKVLEAASEHGLLDDRLFHDAQHPNLRGYVALGQDLLKQLQSRRAFGWPEGVEAPEVPIDECARHFDIDLEKWAEVCQRESKFFEVTAYIRYDPAFRLERCEIYKDAAKSIRDGVEPSAAGIPGWHGGAIPFLGPEGDQVGSDAR
ncbi:MAG: tetratricopeptide repeat protein [Isosphaeraceae bacterium]